jgi:hypothetical protein
VRVLKVVKVAPVFPGVKSQMQNQYDEKTYSSKKRPEISFKSVLEKELQPQIGTKINMLC